MLGRIVGGYHIEVGVGYIISLFVGGGIANLLCDPRLFLLTFDFFAGSIEASVPYRG